MSAPIPLDQLPESDPADWSEEDMANRAVLLAILHAADPEEVGALEELRLQGFRSSQHAKGKVAVFTVKSAKAALRLMPGSPLHRWLCHLLERQAIVLMDSDLVTLE